jgi:hypothetical protein
VASDWPRPQQTGLFQGEALVLWRLRHASGHLRCFVAEWPTGFWLAVECPGGELVVSETLATIDAVIVRAAEVKAPLLAKGWQEE